MTGSDYAPLPTVYDGLFPNGTLLTAPARRAPTGVGAAQCEPSAMALSQEPHPFARGAGADDATAAALVDAWSARTFVEAPSRSRPDLTLADALAIAERVRALRIAAGATPVGYKVGFTNPAVRAQFNAPAPMAAPIYDQTLVATRRIDARGLLGPRIEPEVVVGIGADGEIAWAALGFEIVQSHVPGWNFEFLDAVADFGLHAALIVGDRVEIGGMPIGDLTAMKVRLLRDGELIERGAGSDVEGGAQGSLTWLRAHLRETGRDLVPDEIVTTGSMTRVPPIASGQRWTIEAVGGELPPLTIDVD